MTLIYLRKPFMDSNSSVSRWKDFNSCTQWSKTTVHVLEDPSIESETVAMPSITKTQGKDLWTITYHPVKVIHGQLEMLRTFMDNLTS